MVWTIRLLLHLCSKRNRLSFRKFTSNWETVTSGRRNSRQAKLAANALAQLKDGNENDIDHLNAKEEPHHNQSVGMEKTIMIKRSTLTLRNSKFSRLPSNTKKDDERLFERVYMLTSILERLGFAISKDYGENNALTLSIDALYGTYEIENISSSRLCSYRKKVFFNNLK